MQAQQLFLKNGSKYLKNIFKSNGQFLYRVNLNSNIRVNKKYNMLRHAGTLYALGQYYLEFHDSAVLPVLSRGSEYLLKNSIKPLHDHPDLMAVWTIPEICGAGTELKAKLGGAGISLVGMLTVEKIMRKTTPLKIFQALAKFICYMQKEDGSFFSIHRTEMPHDDRFESLFYPGEATLGVLMLYEIDQNQAWLDCAIHALEFLAKSRVNRKKVEHDHWALIATEKLFELKDKYGFTLENETLIFNHAVQVAKSILMKLERSDLRKITSASLGTNIEGLLSTYHILPQDHELSIKIMEIVPKAINVILEFQVSDHKEFKGGIVRALEEIPTEHLTDESLERAIKFNKRVHEIRIDYVQHTMSAVIQYLKIMKNLNSGQQRTVAK